MKQPSSTIATAVIQLWLGSTATSSRHRSVVLYLQEPNEIATGCDNELNDQTTRGTNVRARARNQP